MSGLVVQLESSQAVTFSLEFLPPESFTLGRAIPTQPSPLETLIHEEKGVHYPVRELVSVKFLQLDDIYLRNELSTGGYLPDYNGKHDTRKFQLPNLVQIWITSLGKGVYSIAASRDVIDQIDLLPPQVESTAPCG
jgi:hypothetical protein